MRTQFMVLKNTDNHRRVGYDDYDTYDTLFVSADSLRSFLIECNYLAGWVGAPLLEKREKIVQSFIDSAPVGDRMEVQYRDYIVIKLGRDWAVEDR